jgi:glycosyltransferase involved in cell wall biosynthesis
MLPHAQKMNTNCDISVITPALNMLKYLKCCAASVRDQEGGEFEHIVVDGGSTDGSKEWLKEQSHIQSSSEPDKGMYDAINKGIGRANGKILAYLNCDEQYLPDTLWKVADYFEKNPGVDMIFGDLILIRPDGSLVAFRKGYRPRWFYIITSHLYVLSCTMFFRRKIVDQGLLFSPGLQAVGDMDFVLRVLRHGYRAEHIKGYLAAFTMTGENLSTDEHAIRERKQIQAGAPFYLKMVKGLLNAARLSEKFFSGAYFQEKPLEYAVYVQEKEEQRKHFCVNKASFRWRFQ